MEFCNGILCIEKKSKIMTFEGKCTQLEITVIKDRLDSKRKTLHVFSYMQNLDFKLFIV